MEAAITVKNLTKSYGDVKAVQGIDFEVEKGSLFAFLGPNGAGKSTTINMICTFLQPAAGEVTVNGFTLGKQDDEIRKIIGAVFQEGVLDKLLSVEENLRVRGSFYGLKDAELTRAIEKTSAITGIGDLLKRRYGKLSGGQRRRCDIARGLIHAPRILFLDEPTTGLDPQTRKHMWETLSKIQQENDMTVFLTTHYMEEAADADYVTVIDDGKITAQGTPSELKEAYSKDRLLLTTQQPDAVRQLLDNSRLA